ncbi:MAG: hypothetical protein COA99_06850 [Moraxellaceae bacterium]|nr:MAG: hypothetical protein COA99_06850 [Moraxellaceae bacterium]
MTWEAMYEEEILELVGAAWGAMTAAQKQIWEKVKISPEKWPIDCDLNELDVVEDNVDIDEDEISVEDTFDIDEDEIREEDTLDIDEDEIGFWVVAVFENTVLWYNDREEGFNLSKYRPYGTIAQYGNKQDDLEVAFQKAIDTGLIPSMLEP